MDWLILLYVWCKSMTWALFFNLAFSTIMCAIVRPLVSQSFIKRFRRSGKYKMWTHMHMYMYKRRAGWVDLYSKFSRPDYKNLLYKQNCKIRSSCFLVSGLKLIEIVILRVYYTIPFGSSFFRYFGIIFQLFELLSLAKDHWRGFNARNAHMVHIGN